MKREKGETMIALTDLLNLFKEKKSQILFCRVLLVVFLHPLCVTRPLQYVAQATFRDKGIKSADAGSF